MLEIKSTALLKDVMKNYFTGIGADGRKVAWCTSVGPAELLRSFGFDVYFPENHGALLGATRTADAYIPHAQKNGYSNQICSYTTSDIGAFLCNETPLKKHYGLSGIPKPDLIVYCTNQCREVEDWFNFYAENFKCPVVGINPPRYLDEVRTEEIEVVISQFKKLIAVCESVSGLKFDIDNLRNVLKLSKEATLLWQEVLKTSTAVPAPFSFFDGTIHMGPIVVMRGTQEAKDYYNVLLSELSEYVEQGKGFIKEENCRLFWDGMPIWGKIRVLSDLFSQSNAVVVASTYCNSWIFDDFDEVNPLESSALAYIKIFINRSEKAKIEFFKKWFTDYKIDGIIYHDSKTCFNNSNSRFGLPLRLKKITQIPYLVVEGDLNDLRFFSEGQTINKIETFIEQIENQKIYK
jgi:benzoyl-CoA reductase/2-hydroxyglutaryl-CoA dehydratase subunit BcrC/BadD/HgdB